MPVLFKPERRRLLESPGPAQILAATTEIDEDEWKWRKLTDSERDLPEYDHQRMLETALYLFRFNPIASRGLKLIRDHTVGGGVRVEAADHSVQKIIDRFWNNPIHKMTRFVPQMSLELALYGEFIVPVTVNTHNGDVELGYISPFVVEKVTLRKDNSLLFDEVILKADSRSGFKSTPLKVINVERDPRARRKLDNPNSPSTFKRRTGDCFYFAVNRVADMTRGLSDLLCAADFIDCLDQLVFSSLERMAHESNWIWDITFTGATQKQIDEWVSKLQRNPPKPGSFNVHNEWVKWEPMPVGLEAQNISDEARLIRNYALGGLGMPVHFFSEPETAGRALAEAMAAPAYQTLSSRQSEIEGFIREILDFVIDQKIIAGLLDEDVDRTFDVIMPKISLRNLQRTGGAMSRITNALDTAQKNEWIDKDLGKRIFLALIDQLGLGVSLRIKPPKETEEESDEELGWRLSPDYGQTDALGEPDSWTL